MMFDVILMYVYSSIGWMAIMSSFLISAAGRLVQTFTGKFLEKVFVKLNLISNQSFQNMRCCQISSNVKSRQFSNLLRKFPFVSEEAKKYCFV